MQRHRFNSVGGRLTITLLLIGLTLILPIIPTWTAPAAFSQQQPDVALVAPVTWGQTLKVIHGFDDHPAGGCVAGVPPDHCDNQKWGLDFVPSNPGDLRILAPLPGSIWWISGECLGIKTEDNLNLSICHFASYNVSVNQSIKRGMVLGTRISTKQWIHLSLDLGFGVPSRDPVPFTGAHTIEGRSFETSQDPVGITITSHNFVPDNEVVFFEGSYFRGGSIRFASKATVDLTQSFGGGFNDKLSAVAIPAKWAVKLYKNSNKTGPSKLIQSTSTSYITVANFANETYDDGSSLDNNVSAIEVYDPTCSGIAQVQTQDSPFISVASAQNSCQNLPTPTPGSPPPISNPPASDGISLVSVSSHTVQPGEYFNPSVTFKVDSGSINASVSFLHATPEDASNRFEAHPTQGFTQNVNAGQTYTFDQNNTTQFRMRAPTQTGTYRSVWQIWNGSRHIGPQAVILINVQDNSNPPPSGWSTDYWTNINLSGGVATHTYEDTIYLFRDWGVNAPNGSVGADNWSAQYVRTYNFQGGEYRFHCQHDDGCRLFIDGQEKIGAWWDSSFTGHDWTGNLSAGNHEVKVHYYEKTGDSRLEAWWQGPGFLPRDQTCVADQWCGEYYGNRNLMGTAAVRQFEDESFLDRGWGFGAPFPGFPENNFSARFTRNVYFGCGTYRFRTIADDGVRLYIDNVLKLDEWHDESADYFDTDVSMTEGDHQLKVEYFENQGDTALRVSWQQLTTCAPATTPTPEPTGTPEPTQTPSTVILGAVEDAYVTAASPSSSFGSDPYLNIDTDPQEVGYLKFNLGSLSGATVSSAKLRIYVANASGDTQQVRETSTSWSEGSITWNNRPSLGSTVVGTINTGGTAGVWKEVDIAVSSVQASVGGTYAIGIDTSGTDGLGFPSSENSSNQVELIINYTGGSAPTPTPTVTPVPSTSTFGATEDTYAESATPDTALGSDPYINIDSDPPEIGFLKFNLSSLSGKTVTSAKLRIYVANASGDSQSIHETSTSWSESTLTWNNKPTLDSTVVGTISTGGTTGVWKEITITASSVQAHVGGTYAIGIDQTGTDGLGFPSSENSNAPELVVTYTQ